MKKLKPTSRLVTELTSVLALVKHYGIGHNAVLSGYGCSIGPTVVYFVKGDFKYLQMEYSKIQLVLKLSFLH